MSVASTAPAGPTRSAGPSGTEGPPAPTSQHRSHRGAYRPVESGRRYRMS